MANVSQPNYWRRWDDEVKRFQQAQERLPVGVKRHWRRTLLFIFMQELSKNLLKIEFDEIIERIIEAMQLCLSFRRVRFYRVNKDGSEIILRKSSPAHWPDVTNYNLKIVENDRAFKSLTDREPFLVQDVKEVTLEYRELLKIEGPYAVIPIIFENKPYGLFTADMVTLRKDHHFEFSSEYREQFETLSYYVMSAIENRKIFDHRRQTINQLKYINKLSEIILREEDQDKLLRSLMQHSVKLVNATGGHLKVYNEDTKLLERVADYGKDIAPPEIQYKPMGIGFSNEVFKKGESLIIDDTEAHPLMVAHKEYCRQNLPKKGYSEYLQVLENRKSAMLVPLKTPEGKVIGVIDLHSNEKNHFTEIHRENVNALVSGVMIALDKSHKLDQLRKINQSRSRYLKVLQNAIEKAYSLDSVLEIVRNGCVNLLSEKVENVCLLLLDPASRELNSPSIKCMKKDIDCEKCMEQNLCIQQAKISMKWETSEDRTELAIPILAREDVVGVLYLEANDALHLSENERDILTILSKTAAILMTTARNYEQKIKQVATLSQVGRLSSKKREFHEWFHPIMEKVMQVLRRDNRNFHLVLVKENNGKKELVISQTSDLYIDGKPVKMKQNLLGLKLPMNGSVSGHAIKSKKIIIIDDVEEYRKRQQENPAQYPYYEHDPRIQSEVVIPMIVKDQHEGSQVVGTLVIDSVRKNDFHDLDLEFIQTMADYLAISIKNMQLYEERAKIEEELMRSDRSVTLSTMINYFSHEFTKPMQEIQSRINLIKMELEENKPIPEDDLQHIEDNLEILQSILDKFKDYFKPFQTLKTSSLTEIVDRSLAFTDKMRGLNLDIKGNFRSSKAKLLCFPDALELAFRLIISNAVKYSQGIERSKRFLEINISENGGTDEIEISFTNRTSVLIPENKLKTIFEPYVRGTNKEKGIGLGLALAKLCVQRHFGEIKAENINSDKVRFTIILPTKYTR